MRWVTVGKTAVGIDIGGTNIRASNISEDGRIIKGLKEPLSSSPIESAIALIDGIITDDTVGIGVGVAGIVDRGSGRVTLSPNIPQIVDISITRAIQERFHLPVVVENDADAYAYGEKWVGSGKGFKDFVLLTLGTGIGGGIIYDGDLFKGAAEVGHMIIEGEGVKCACGGYGCLEAYASGRAIVNKAVEAIEKGQDTILRACCNGNFYKLTGELIYRAALDGDNLSREIFRDFGRYLGIGMATLANLFSPEAIILGGGLLGAWDLFIELARKEFHRRTLAPLQQKVSIIKSSLGQDAGAIGAAGLVFKSL